ncbi:MAG: acyl-CoA thioesterase, partial [Acidobacteriota bacterium]|nr:acyl-CoA thioesterase [Acidobacteriota bacterium]
DSGLRTQDLRFSVQEYVRWEDIDAAGIINYQAYLRFFGLAEVELFRSCGLTYKTLFDDVGVWLPRVHVECDFFHPVTLDELLIVEAFFGKIGKSSIHLNFEVQRKENPDVIVATGKYVLVTVKKGQLVPTPVPDMLREKLQPYVEEKRNGTGRQKSSR